MRTLWKRLSLCPAYFEMRLSVLAKKQQSYLLSQKSYLKSPNPRFIFKMPSFHNTMTFMSVLKA